MAQLTCAFVNVGERQILGIEFADRSPGEVMVEVAGKGKLKYNLIVTIPFNSTRKRMSVIVQAPDGSYALYCKVSVRLAVVA